MAVKVITNGGTRVLEPDQIGWNVTETVTPPAMGMQSSGQGAVNFEQPYEPDLEFVYESTATVEHERLGSVAGRLGGGSFSGEDGLELPTQFTMTSILGGLSVQRQSGPVINGSLEDVYTQYIRLVYASGVEVDYQATDANLYNYAGWEGNVWEHLCQLGAATGTELLVQGGTVVIRDIGVNLVNFKNIIPTPSYDINQENAGRTVDYVIKNAEAVQSSLDFIYNYVLNPTVETNANGWQSSGFGTLPGMGTTFGRVAATTPYGSYVYRAGWTSGTLTAGGPYNVSLAAGPQDYLSPSTKVIDVSGTPLGTPLWIGGWTRVINTLGAILSSATVNILFETSPGVFTSNGGASIPAPVSGGAYFTVPNVIRPLANTSGRAIMTVDYIYDIPASASPRTGQLYADFDAFIVSEGPVQPYFDGSYTGSGAVWQGTAGNSISIMPNPLANGIAIYDALEDDNTIISVEAGETTTIIVNGDSYPLTIRQLIPSVVINTNPIGTYHVTDSIGLPIQAQQWLDYGGSVVASIEGQRPGDIQITVVGPRIEIPGTTGPYKLATTDGEVERGAIKIAGSGVLTRPETLNLGTGADPEAVTADKAQSIDYPFLNTIADAYRVAGWVGYYSNGAFPRVVFSVPTREIEAFGATVGSVFRFKEANYRILSLNINDVSTRLEAILYTSTVDFVEENPTATTTDVETVWGMYRTKDFKLKALRKI